MLFVNSDRNILIESLVKGGIGAELGVFKGENAEFIFNTVEPKELHLIDQWKYNFNEINPFYDIPEHLSEVENVTKFYMGNNINESLQGYSLDVRRKFKDNKNVFIYRKKTYEAVKEFQDNYFDFIYIDASHQYEYVLRDLLDWSPKLKQGGIIFMNDFYESEEGRKQNLGTIPAVSSFMKRGNSGRFFEYLALTSEPWSDLTITNDKNSPYCRDFLNNLLSSGKFIIEINPLNVCNYNHKYFQTNKGEFKIIPSFYS
jgi:hypothetical protein